MPIHPTRALPSSSDVQTLQACASVRQIATLTPTIQVHTRVINDCGVHSEMIINDDVEFIARQVADEVQEAAVSTVLWLQPSTSQISPFCCVRQPQEGNRHECSS